MELSLESVSHHVLSPTDPLDSVPPMLTAVQLPGNPLSAGETVGVP
jgi:hypothetical protein